MRAQMIQDVPVGAVALFEQEGGRYLLRAVLDLR